MKLYWNGTLADPLAGEAAVEKAFERLRAEGDGVLELRRAADQSARVSRLGGEGFFMEAVDGEARLGMLVPEEGGAALRGALLDFQRGSRPRLPTELFPKPDAGLREVVLGDGSDDDCPLCAMMRGGYGA